VRCPFAAVDKDDVCAGAIFTLPMTATSILFLVFFCLFFLLTSPAFVFTQSPENNSLRGLAAGPQGGCQPPTQKQRHDVGAWDKIQFDDYVLWQMM